MKLDQNKKRLRVYIPLVIIVVIVLSGSLYWYREYEKYISSDDAHIDAENVTVSPKIMGRISRVFADEGTEVTEGMLLAVLDSADLLAQKKQSLAQRAQAEANLRQTELKYKSDQTGIRILEINLEKASDDFARAKSQSEGGVITAEQFDHIKKMFESASAQLEAAKAQLTVSNSQISTASAALELSNAQVNVIDTQLKNTRLFAPCNGIITKRWLLQGDIVQPSQSIFTLTNDKKLWVVAFLEETKISNIRIGQDVRFSIDAIPGVKFYGKIFLIGSNTASVFSLIPPNNASGNFTKVTQRIPIRISIDSVENQQDISRYKILTGMSVVVKIIK